MVPNNSFEEYIETFEIESNGWRKCLKSDTPDYFNFDSLNFSNNIFDEYMGNVIPRSGDACIGLFFYRRHKVKKGRNIREYIQTELTRKLVKDSTYKFEMYVWLDVESNVALQDFGVFFSQDELYHLKDKDIFELTPQLKYTGDFINNKNKWNKVSGIYKAEGNEQFIIIGSFTPDSRLKRERLIVNLRENNKKPKWNTDNSEYISYYYIDDVSIEPYQEEVNMPAPEKTISKSDLTFIKKQYNIDNIDVDSIVVLDNILFEFDKTEVQAVSYDELSKLLKLLKDNPTLRIDIYGHTDITGDNKYNQELSENRAKTISNYLIENGIEEHRLSYKGFGSNKPISNNDTEAGREKNRRVEFKIIEK